MCAVYSSPKNYSIVRAGLEVYKTDEVNFKPYISAGASNSSSSNSETDSSDSSTDDTNSIGYTYHQGEIREIYHYANLYSANYESDYKEMNNSATITVPEVDKNRFYKGVRVSLKKEWEEPGKTLVWDDLKSVTTGFITEQTFNEETVEVKIDGLSKLLDQKYTFDFSNMKRSKILEEIIKTAGLEADIDVNGLDDDVTSFKSSSSDSSSGSGKSTGSATIDEAVENAINGVSGDLAKAKAIDKAFKEHVIYSYYFDCKYPDLDKAWSVAHLNCADGANVLCAMFIKGGFDAVIHHTPGKDGNGHYIVRVKVKGKVYATDNAASDGQHTTRSFGEVWGPSSGTAKGTKIG